MSPRPIFLRVYRAFPWRSALVGFLMSCATAVWLAIDPIVVRMLP
jgi:hypothetical protein